MALKRTMVESRRAMILVNAVSLSAPVVLAVLILVMALLFLRAILSLLGVRFTPLRTHMFDLSIVATVVVFLLVVYLRFKIIG